MKKVGPSLFNAEHPVIQKDPYKYVDTGVRLPYGPGQYKVDERRAALQVGYSTRLDDPISPIPRGVNPFATDYTPIRMDTFRPPDFWLCQRRLQPLSRQLRESTYQRVNPHTESMLGDVDINKKYERISGPNHPYTSILINPSKEDGLGDGMNHSEADRSGRYQSAINRNTPLHPYTTSAGQGSTTENVGIVHHDPIKDRIITAIYNAIQANAGIELDLRGTYIDHKLTVQQLISMVTTPDAPIQLYNERESEYVKLSNKDIVSITPNPEGDTLKITIVGQRNPLQDDLKSALKHPHIFNYRLPSENEDSMAPILQNPELRENVRNLPKKKLLMTYAPTCSETIMPMRESPSSKLLTSVEGDEYSYTPDEICLGQSLTKEYRQQLGTYSDEIDPVTGKPKSIYGIRKDRIKDLNPTYQSALLAAV